MGPMVSGLAGVWPGQLGCRLDSRGHVHLTGRPSNIVVTGSVTNRISLEHTVIVNVPQALVAPAVTPGRALAGVNVWRDRAASRPSRCPVETLEHPSRKRAALGAPLVVRLPSCAATTMNAPQAVYHSNCAYTRCATPMPWPRSSCSPQRGPGPSGMDP